MSLRPLYSFKCSECKQIVDTRLHMNELETAKVYCPTDGTSMQKIITAPAGIIFQGPGFYSTDGVARPNAGRNPNNQNRHSKG